MVDETRHLYARAHRQIIDEPMIGHIAIDNSGSARLHRPHNARCIFSGISNVELLCVCHLFFLPAPSRDLFLTPANVLVQRHVELFNKIGAVPLNEPRHIFRKMFTRFRHKIAGAFQQLIAHLIGDGLLAPCSQLFYARVEIFNAAILMALLKAQIERHVIDAGTLILD